MDLNYLYHRRGVSLFRAQNASCLEARRVHGALAKGYRRQIATLQENARHNA